MRMAAVAMRTSMRKARNAPVSASMADDEKNRDQRGEIRRQEGIGEERNHDERHEQRRYGAHGNGRAYVTCAPCQHLEPLIEVLRAVGLLGRLGFPRARPIDDARQAIGEHARA